MDNNDPSKKQFLLAKRIITVIIEYALVLNIYLFDYSMGQKTFNSLFRWTETTVSNKEW